ncbi:MAG: response regulator [Rhodospirillum sp.]|nr:response regulator [Rhodospirillum sp.]MCF8490148.1 response regulator [Rhodospirillum sp.]MCF8502090.1 response regulator [Rhodospirillum sp.]
MKQIMDYGHFDILIVEDQEAVRGMLRGFLFKIGVKAVAEASDGVEAMRVLEGFTPSIILCDIDMKPMNGFDFLQALRKSNLGARHSPVIMLTSHSDEMFVNVAKAFQVDGYLVKPFNGPRLKVVLDNALKGRPKTGGLDRLRQYLATSDPE